MPPISPSLRHLQRLVVTTAQCQGEQVQLTAQQRHYLERVLRLQPGQQFIAILSGQWWLAELTTAASLAQLLETLPNQTELPVAVTLLAALPKGNGFEQVISQATELGVTTIQPVISQRTLLQPSAHKQERWQRLAQEAAEQSLRQVVPQLLPPLPLAMVWQQANTPHKYICLPDAGAVSLHHCLGELGAHTLSDISVATGPEGGWTREEVAEAIAAGFTPVHLGARVLRAVTAPLVALTIIAAHLE